MNEAKLKVIKNKLLAEEENIKKRMIELKKDDPFSDPDYSNDNAAVDSDVREQEAHQRIEAEIETLKERAADVTNALKRMEKGRYGYCKRCNKEIPQKRLELIPETIYCVQCESELKK
jgi:RNA polymerase-binding transcription factor DksA